MAISPTSRASGISPVGVRIGGRLGPPPPAPPSPDRARRGSLRPRCVASTVSGSSKKSNSMSSSSYVLMASGVQGRPYSGREIEARCGSPDPHRTSRGNGPPAANLGRPMSNTALAVEGSGLMLGRYRPLRPLGSGGSGSVWLARDEQTGLDIALKIVPREGKTAARAEREAQAAARLRHPSCLRAYAFARDPGHVYIAYEYVPGRTFREALRAGELNDAKAIAAC